MATIRAGNKKSEAGDGGSAGVRDAIRLVIDEAATTCNSVDARAGYAAKDRTVGFSL